MPVYGILHVGNALTLDGVSNNCSRLIRRFGLAQCRLNLLKIMTVDCDDMPAESLKLAVNRLGGVNLLNCTVNLQVVEVHKRR